MIGEIGHGGMGVVYKAINPAGNETVAIKLIQGSASMSRRGRIGLVREARVAGSLNHPNVVTIYDIGQYRGWLYLVMEYLSGVPLNRMIRSNETLSIDEKLKILVQLCEALDHAHSHGVIHRDVKPANTFIVGHSRIVKVVDFGLAVQTDVAGDNQLAGTFPYMSPEQLGGQKLDCSTDVWSAGVTAYELLTGNLPFCAVTSTELRNQILTAPLPPLDSSIPLAAELDRVLSHALAKNQKERCTARALSTDFRLLAHRVGMGVDHDTESSLDLASKAAPQLGERSALARDLPYHYANIDLGFRCPSVGRVTLRRGKVPVRQLLRSVHEVKRSFGPSSGVLAAAAGGTGVILLLIALPFFFLLQAFQWALTALDLIVRHPRCRGCGLTMSLTSSWARLVKSNAEVVLGYRDCIAALQENLWQDAAKLLYVHGFEDSLFHGHELISTPLRYHLDFYECGICSDHAARLTTDDLIEHKWISRLEFTEAYRGESVSIVTTLKRIGSAPSHIARSAVGCIRHAVRHANPINFNMRVCSTMLLFLVVMGLALQSQHIKRVNERMARRYSTPTVARLNTGNMPVHGVHDNKELFAEYYKIAISQGNSREQGLSANALGEMCEKGIGVQRDYVKAVSWYRIAAQHGNTDAAMNLGRLYENGIGVRRDLAEAKYWYLYAGAKEAADRVSRLKAK